MRLYLLTFLTALFLTAGCSDPEDDTAQKGQQYETGHRKADGTYTTDPPAGSEPPVVDVETDTTRGTLKRDEDGNLIPQLKIDREQPR